MAGAKATMMVAGAAASVGLAFASDRRLAPAFVQGAPPPAPPAPGAPRRPPAAPAPSLGPALNERAAAGVAGNWEQSYSVAAPPAGEGGGAGLRAAGGG